MLDLNEIPKTHAVLHNGIGHRLHAGVHLSIARRQVALDRDLALCEARPGVPMPPDTLMTWMSAAKPVVGITIAQPWERGLLGLDDRVAKHIPEFGSRRKEAIS